MQELTLKTGDIFLTNNYSVGAKIVMGLMTAPTIWHHIFWKITGRIEKERPNFYHAGMVLNETQIIEQQNTVKIRSIDRIFRKDYVVWRNKNLAEHDKNWLVAISLADVGEGYGILECFGKLFTWLTGIKWFSKWFDMKNRAICVVRVAEWYLQVGIDFGVSTPNYVTAKILHNYCKNHSDEWEQLTEVIR